MKSQILLAGMWGAGIAQSRERFGGNNLIIQFRVNQRPQHLMSWALMRGCAHALPQMQHKVPFITRCDLQLARTVSI